MILPIHLLDSSDELEFGKEYVLLSKLSRLGFPVATGFVVSPPRTEIRNFIVDHSINSLRDFEVKQNSLRHLLLNHFAETQTLSVLEKDLLILHWPEMVKRWMMQVESHFTRFDKFDQKLVYLKSAPLFVTSQIIAQGTAHWNSFSRSVTIDLIVGDLDHGYMAFIDDLVRRMNKKLGVEYSYQFVVTEDGLKIIHIDQTKHDLTQSVSPVTQKDATKKTKRSLKLFATFSGSLVLDEDCDGYFLESHVFDSHDQKQLVLLETMIAKYPQIVLYQISERFIKSDAAAIKLCRNLKKQDNLEIVFPFDENIESLMELKRTLASLGVNRKGKLKFWVKVGLPGLAIQYQNLEDDFDGIIFDIDLLAAALHGRDITEQGDEKDIVGLMAFMEPLIKQLTKKHVPVILSGRLMANEQLIKQAVLWHVMGLVVRADTLNIDQQVSFAEQKLSFGLI